MKITSRCKVKKKNWERQTFNLLFLLQHTTIYILSLLKHKQNRKASKYESGFDIILKFRKFRS